jgi:hypothetical protein
MRDGKTTAAPISAPSHSNDRAISVTYQARFAGLYNADANFSAHRMSDGL